MKRRLSRRVLLPLAFAACLLYWACGNDPAPKPLSDEVLRNAAYPSDLLNGKLVQLKDGQFSEDNPGGFGKSTVRLIDPRGTGSIDAGKTADSAIILAESGGGSGTFYNLYAVLNDDGRPAVKRPVLLGDRVVVHSVDVVGRQVIVKMRIQSPRDPLCCPTLETTATYALKGDVLELVSRME